jgi:dUTPase
MILVKIKLNGGMMPEKKHIGDAAYDLYVPDDVPIIYGRMLIDMKFAMELPYGKAAIIQPRSGCSLNGIEVFKDKGEPLRVEVHNDKGESRYIDADVKIGLVDSNYRKNVGTILQIRDYAAVAQGVWYIKKGSRISQMRIVDVPETRLIEVESLSETERDGGFGTTGQRQI